MSLRMRLSLAFVFVVLAPLVIAAVLVARGVPESSSGQSTARAQAAAAGSAQLLTERCSAAELVAQGAAWEAAAAGARRAVDDAVAAQTRSGRSAYVAVVGPGGAVRAAAGRLPPAAARVVAGRSPLALGSCVGARSPSPYVVAAQVPVRAAGGAAKGTVVVALPLDGALLATLHGVAGGDVTLLAGPAGHRAVVASTLPAGAAGEVAALADRLTAGRPLAVGGYTYDAVPPGAGRAVTVVVRVPRGSSGTGLPQELGAVVVAALVLAVALGWLLARMTTRPLVELAGAAERVAQGDLDTRIPVGAHDEVGQLGVAFNEMTDHLRTYIEALQSSRDELRGNLTRLGETLSGTHDLGRILTVILETAMASVRARGGALLLGSAGRGDLHVRISRGVDDLPAGTRVRLGDGVLGMVAGGGEAVRGRVDAAGDLAAPGAPVAGSRSVLAVPLKRSGRVHGVLALYDRIDTHDFDAADLETIRTFSGQATVAIDNVLLHQEAQRLSITDGLTGLWNYRYFTMNFAKEIERAARFHRPLALLLLDLDKFKTVNDSHGHQRGDSVLIELATRVSAEIREVDTFARYGGEEFVLVLPETGGAGACQVAERLCQVVRHRPFGHQGEEPLPITVSVGVAVFPGNGMTAAALIRAADTALYAAKNEGRDGWRLATDLEVAAGRGE